MNTKLANFLSIIFHPVLIPLYAVLISLQFPIHRLDNLGIAHIMTVVGITILFTIVLPVLAFYFLKKKGIIEDFYMENGRERNLPYVIMIVCYALATYILQQIPLILPVFLLIFINSGIVVFVVLLINSFTKISAHLASLGALVAYLYNLSALMKMDLFLWLTFFIIISSLLIIARYELKAHTKIQVYTGFFIGISVTTILLQSLFGR